MKQNDYVSHLSTRNKKSKKKYLNVKKPHGMHTDVYIWGAYNKLYLAEGMLELKLHLIKFSRIEVYCVHGCISRDLFHKNS